MIRIRPDFERQIAKAGMSKAALIDRAGIAKATLYFIINPSTHPHRKTGTLRAVTAWKIARAFAEQTGITEDEAYNRLFVEESREQHRIRRTPDLAARLATAY